MAYVKYISEGMRSFPLGKVIRLINCHDGEGAISLSWQRQSDGTATMEWCIEPCSPTLSVLVCKEIPIYGSGWMGWWNWLTRSPISYHQKQQIKVFYQYTMVDLPKELSRLGIPFRVAKQSEREDDEDQGTAVVA